MNSKMKAQQDPKYQIESIITNRETGVAIPDDEPIFILRSKDKLAAPLLKIYLHWCQNSGEHAKAVGLRLAQFEKFALDNPFRMKLPDNAINPDFSSTEESK